MVSVVEGAQRHSRSRFSPTGRDRLRRPLQRSQGGHQPRTAPAVVAGAEDFDVELRRRIGADHDVDRLAGEHGLLRAVALDPGRAEAAAVQAHARQLPIQRAGLGVLVADQRRTRRLSTAQDRAGGQHQATGDQEPCILHRCLLSFGEASSDIIALLCGGCKKVAFRYEIAATREITCSRESKRLPEECHGSDLLRFSRKPVLRDFGGGQIRLDSGHHELAALEAPLATGTEHRQLVVAFRDQSLGRVGYPAARLRNE